MIRRPNLLGLVLLLGCTHAMGQAVRPAPSPAPAPATRPAVEWQAKWFNYQRAKALAVEESKPTDAQVNFRVRPPQLKDARAAIQPATKPAEPLRVGAMRVRRLCFQDSLGDAVPVLLCLPAEGAGPFPVVIAVHGLGSFKAQVCAQVGLSLTRRGFAVLAADMPCHGERPGEPLSLLDWQHFAEAVQRYQQAVLDVRQCIDLAESRKDLNVKAGVLYVGYSMGSLIGSIAGPADERIKAMALMVGGAPQTSPLAAALPGVAAIQPQLAIPHFVGRPLFLLNGRDDRIIPRAMTETLYAAAAEPKQIEWYASGHFLPAEAYEDAAEWLLQQWKTANP